MENELSRSLYKNSTISIVQSYRLIEKFITETRLPFVDYVKLIELLTNLLPQEENRLTPQGFLNWIVKNLENPEPQQNDFQTAQHFKRQRTNQFDIPTAIPRDFSQENSSDSNEDFHQNSTNFQLGIKLENVEQVESEIEEETSDLQIPVNVPSSSSMSINLVQHRSTELSTTVFQGRDMMKHLRPRTTITSFARHVASDLYSREEIMNKMHVDQHDERAIFLRHCIRTAWHLNEGELHNLWPKIRNALLQLRRDAVAGKCIRISTSHSQNSHSNRQSTSDDEDEFRPI